MHSENRRNNHKRLWYWSLNEQNGRQFEDNIFEWIFFNLSLFPADNLSRNWARFRQAITLTTVD